MPRYDFQCTNKECKLHEAIIEETVTLQYVAMGYRPECKACGTVMEKLIVSPANFQIKKDDYYYVSKNPNAVKAKMAKIKEQWRTDPRLKKRAKRYNIY